MGTRKHSPRSMSQMTLITGGPLLSFYDRPSPLLNRFQHSELRIIWLILRGECFRVPIYSDESSSSSFSSSSSIPSSSRTRHLERILFLDPAQVQHIVRDHELIGWRYTGAGRQGPLESQTF